MILGDKLYTKKNKKTTTIYVFLVESRQAKFYTHVLKVYINFQSKTQTLRNITKLTRTILLMVPQ